MANSDNRDSSSGNGDRSSGNGSASSQRKRIPPVEWAVAAVGATLLVSILAFLVREAVQEPGRPADIVATIDTVLAGRGGWLVRVSARNLGDEAAVDVTLRGTLSRAGVDPLSRDTHLDYLPAHSQREMNFVYPSDPRAGRLTIEVLGHQAP